MLRCGSQVRLTKREVDALAESVKFVPEGIRTEADLRDWFSRVTRYYMSQYRDDRAKALLARQRLDQELSKLLEAA